MTSIPKDCSIPIWLDEHNIEFELYSKYEEIEGNYLKKKLWHREAKYLKKWELKCWQRAEKISCCSESDKSTICFSNSHTKVIPNTSYFQEEHDTVPFNKRLNQILMSGSMGWTPNVEGALWFYNSIWPKVLKNNPTAKWVIAGRDPDPKILALHGKYNITVTGEVKSMAPYIANSKVSIVPLITGSGTRIKILEAAQQGLPCVTTSKGTEGLSFSHQNEIIIEDNEKGFANSISDLLSGEQLWNQLSAGSRNRFQEDYSFKKIESYVSDFLSLDHQCNPPHPSIAV